jgi:hypothetical protein
MGLKTGLILMLALQTARADVITSTFGSDDGFTTSGGYQVGGGAVDGVDAEMAVLFTPAFDEVLTQLRVAAFCTPSTGGDHDLVLALSEGAVPEAPIETFGTSVLDGKARIYTFNSLLQPTLLEGQTYWIILASNDLVNNSFGWNFTATGLYSTMAERTSELSQWQLFNNESPAFEVSGQPTAIDSIPEPRTMLGVGLALVFLSLRRRNHTMTTSA